MQLFYNLLYVTFTFKPSLAFELMKTKLHVLLLYKKVILV